MKNVVLNMGSTSFYTLLLLENYNSQYNYWFIKNFTNKFFILVKGIFKMFFFLPFKSGIHNFKAYWVCNICLHVTNILILKIELFSRQDYTRHTEKPSHTGRLG